MLKCRIYGGLGNQLFQFSKALLVMKQINAELLCLDTSAVSKYRSKRSFDLFEVLNVNFASLGMDVILRDSLLLKTRIPRLSKGFGNFVFLNDKNPYFEGNLGVDSRVYLDGYFQRCMNEKALDSAVKMMKPLLKGNKFNTFSEICAVHVRGGDFVKLGWDTIAGRDYFSKAINDVRNNYGVKDFKVYTDDPGHAEKVMANLLPKSCFMDSSDPINDFSNIGYAKYRILSGSTFAFWASALGRHPDPIVYAPKYWRPGVERKLRLIGEQH